MRVYYHKDFIKQVAKLKQSQKTKLRRTIEAFKLNPTDPILYNHPLKGRWSGYRSIAFGGDWRAHYEQTDDGSVWFIACGTHSQLYR
jgi:addiction module RelE/StbE family toxin